MLDHDDYWPDYKLEQQITAFEDPDVILSYGICCVVNLNGSKICNTAIPDDPASAMNDPTGSALNELLFRRYSFIINSTVMLRRRTLETIGGFVDIKGLYHDFTTWVRLSLEGKFAPFPVCLGFHRKHPSAVTYSSDKRRNFEIRVAFLRTFVAEHEKKLRELGLLYDPELLGKRWEALKKEHLGHVHYDMAMVMLSCGRMGEAEAEFRRFLEHYPTAKNRFIHALISLSALTGTDLVNPAARMKEWAGALFRKNR
jgi:hypothetical protein